MTYDLPYPYPVIDRFKLQDARSEQMLWMRMAQAGLQRMEQQDNELQALRKKASRKGNKIDQAMALKFRRKDLSDAKVAEAIGCHQSTLTRSPEYQRIAAAADKALVRDRRRDEGDEER